MHLELNFRVTHVKDVIIKVFGYTDPKCCLVTLTKREAFPAAAATAAAAAVHSNPVVRPYRL